MMFGWFTRPDEKNMALLSLWIKGRHCSRGQRRYGRGFFCAGGENIHPRCWSSFKRRSQISRVTLTYFISVQGFLLINTITSMTWLWLFPRMCGSTFTTGNFTLRVWYILTCKNYLYCKCYWPPSGCKIFHSLELGVTVLNVLSLSFLFNFLLYRSK